LGIWQIGQLATLPRDALASRFDSQLLLRLDQATGAVAEPIVSHRPPPGIVAEKLLEFPTDDQQVLDLILRELIEQVCQLLITHQQGETQPECTLQCKPTHPDAPAKATNKFPPTGQPRSAQGKPRGTAASAALGTNAIYP